MKTDDHDYSIQDIVNELNALDEYASKLPESERKSFGGGMAEMAAIIRRLRNGNSSFSAEPNDIQTGMDSVPIDHSINPSHLGKETIQALLDAAEAFAFLVLPDGRVTAVNKWITRMMGKPASELIGQSAFMGLPANVARFRKKKIQEVLKTKKPLCFEDMLDDLTFRHNLYPIMDHKGNVKQIAIVGFDITGHKRAEEDLRESKERLRAIYTGASDIIAYVDRSGTILDINKSSIFGHARSDLIGKKFYDLGIIKSSDLPAVIKTFRDLMASSMEMKFYEVEINDIDGNPIYLEASSRLIRKENKIEGLVAVVRDITERKKADKALQKSQELLGHAVAGSNGGEWELDFGTANNKGYLPNKIYLSPRLKKMIGFNDDEFPNSVSAWRARILTEDLERLKKVSNDHLRGETDLFEIDYRIHHRDGSLRWMFSRGRIQRDKSGRPVRWTGIDWDITDRKQAEEMLRESEERYRLFLKNFQGIAYKGNIDWTAVFFHGAVEKITGYSETDFVNCTPSWFEIVHLDDIPKIRESIDRIRDEANYSTSREYRIIRKDGGQRWVCELIRNLCDEDGKPVMVQGTIYDISERRRMEEELSQRENMLRSILISAPIGIGLSIDRIISWANNRICEITGYSMQELIGKNTSFLYDDKAEFDRVGQERERLIQERSFGTIEAMLKCKDGRLINVLLSASPVDLDSRSSGLIFTVLDITASKQAAEQLRLVQFAVDHSSDAAFWMGSDSKFIYVNDSACRSLGYTRDELMKMSVFDIDLDFTPEIWPAHWNEIKQRGSVTVESRHISREGKVIPVEIVANYVDFGGQEFNCAFARDITERKQAELALKKNQELLNETQRLAKVGGWLYDVETETVVWTDETFRIHDLPIENKAKIENSLSCYRREDRPVIMDAFTKAITEARSYDLEFPLITARNREIWIRTIGRPVMEDDKVVGVLGNIIDITERKAAERELEKSREVYRALAENSPDVIVRYDHQMKCVYANRACGSVLNLYPDEIVGSKPTEMNFNKNKAKKVEKHVKQVISSGKPFQAEVELEGKEGKLRFDWRLIPEFTPSGEVETVLSIARDVTETKRLQEFTSRAMRLETAGRIAGQVAHDFNNLLGPLMAYPDLIADSLSPRNEALPLIDDMKRAAEQIAEINQQLLTLGRRGHYNLQPLNLNDIIEQIIGDIFPLSETLVIEKNLAADLMNINAGKSQILRALSNLISNARDAMQDIGYLIITTENFYVDDIGQGPGHIPHGEYVRLTISDTGSGMSRDVLARVFEPFYTTKTTTRKRGSGLGLSVVHAVVEDHNGYIDCESTTGKGTSMYLYFPITRENVEKPQTDQIITGSESILVIDDDKIQRDVTLTLLKRLGYDAVAAECGEKALELLNKKRFDLIVLDMVMPNGMDGTDTYIEALKINPDQKAIIVSGYAESERVSLALNLGIGAFYKKPLMLKTLSHAIRKELDKPINQLI